MARAAAPQQLTDGIHLLGRVYGELRAEDLPFSPQAQGRYDALTKGDEDIYPVVIGVGVGEGGRGWQYQPEYLKLFVDKVNSQGMFGILGHQKHDDIAHQFPEPVTHWLAAKWDPEAPVYDQEGKATGDKGVAYFRGVVDPSAPNVKRWLRSKTIRQPSIYGFPTLEQVGGKTVVRSGKPMSIDWAPLDRAGMATAHVLAFGEMDAVQAPGAGAPAGGTGTTQNPGGKRTMGQTLREAVGELRDMNATPQQLIREMGWQPNEVIAGAQATFDAGMLARGISRDVLHHVAAGEIAATHKLEDLLPAFGAKLDAVAPLLDKGSWDNSQAVAKAFGEMAVLFGMTEADAKDPAKVVAKAKAVQEEAGKANTAAFRSIVEKVVASGEMAIPEAVRPIVTDLLVGELAKDAGEDAIKKAAGEMKVRPSVKVLLGNSYGGTSMHVQQDNHGQENNGQGKGDGPHTTLTFTRRSI